MSLQIGTIMFLTACIHATETCNYAVRLAGIRISKLAVAFSLNAVIALVARTSNLVQSPLTGNLVDVAKLNAHNDLLYQLQTVVFGATLGTLVAFLFFPTMISIGVTIINKFESTGSVVRMAIGTMQFSTLKTFKFKPFQIRSLNFGSIRRYKGLFLINVLITGVYTVGVLSAQYASYLVPEYSTMAASSAGLINGIAMILLALFIDPKIALISDKVMSGNEQQSEITMIYIFIILSRLAGTLLAQILLLPSSELIAFVCKSVTTFLHA